MFSIKTQKQQKTYLDYFSFFSPSSLHQHQHQDQDQESKSGWFTFTKTKHKNKHILFYYKRDIRNKQIVITHFDNGDIDYEKYFFNSNCNEKLHCLNGPAYISYKNGNIVTENWFVNGKKHRTKDSGPTFISYHTRGDKQIEAWYSNNVLHRIEGPAFIDYDNFKEEWYIKGKFIKQTDNKIKIQTYLQNGVFFHIYSN